MGTMSEAVQSDHETIQSLRARIETLEGQLAAARAVLEEISSDDCDTETNGRNFLTCTNTPELDRDEWCNVCIAIAALASLTPASTPTSKDSLHVESVSAPQEYPDTKRLSAAGRYLSGSY